jgi:hypothetical protein
MDNLNKQNLEEGKPIENSPSPWLLKASSIRGKIVFGERHEIPCLRTRKDLIMTRVNLDAALLSKLFNLTQPLELCDESGRLLGRFIPIPDLSRANGAEPQLSEEELQRREQEPDYSTAEVLGRLLPTIDSTRYEGLEPQVSREEIQRRKENKGKTYTTAEVLTHLENL